MPRPSLFPSHCNLRAGHLHTFPIKVEKNPFLRLPIRLKKDMAKSDTYQHVRKEPGEP